MHNQDFDIVIIGGGCIGASIFNELTLMGHPNVALIDKGRHASSATSQSGGMTRVFHESPHHLLMALKSHLLRSSYEQDGILTDSGKTNGSLYFFNHSRLQSYESNLKIMKTAHYPFELLTKDEGESRFPQFHWKEDELAIFEPLGSHQCPMAFTNDLISHSSSRGGCLFDNYEVEKIRHHLDRYRICCDQGTITARYIILAGGARFLPILKDFGIHLPLSTRVLQTFEAKKIDKNLSGPNFFDRETLEFGRFGHADSVLLSEKNITRLAEKNFVETFTVNTALDCYSPDRCGYLGQVSGQHGLIIATGWGGTAFKFSPAIGREVGKLMDNQKGYGEYANV